MSLSGVRKVVFYLESRGVEVRKGRDNAYFPDDDVIIYNTQGGYKSQLYTLLHEAGHFLQKKSKNFTAMNLSFGSPDSLHTNYQKFRLLEQEMDAWSRGLKLAKTLELKIDVINYRKTAAIFIMKYVKHIANE